MGERLSIRLIKDCVLFPPYLLSFLVPRCRDIWVFGAWFGRRYADNSRYVFDYIVENEPGIRAVWISRDKKIIQELRRDGREAYLAGSWLGYWMCCRAAVAVVTCGLTDLNVPGAARAKKVQLWHGTPLKKIKLDDTMNENHKWPAWVRFIIRIWRAVFPYSAVRWEAIVSPSENVSPRLMSAFGAGESQIRVTGYPRCDVILDPKPTPVRIVEQVKRQWNAKKMVFYVPTHRGAGRDSVDLFAGLDAAKLDECLARHDAVLLVKMHFYHRQQGARTDCPRVHWLSEEEAPDINRILPFADVLITDYSSVYFDYVLLNRPIVFAPFDKERYLTRDREFYEDYDSATPGPKCSNWEEVIRELESVLSGQDSWEDARKACRSKYNAFVDTENSKRVVEVAKEMLGWNP